MTKEAYYKELRLLEKELIESKPLRQDGKFRITYSPECGFFLEGKTPLGWWDIIRWIPQNEIELTWLLLHKPPMPDIQEPISPREAKDPIQFKSFFDIPGIDIITSATTIDLEAERLRQIAKGPRCSWRLLEVIEIELSDRRTVSYSEPEIEELTGISGWIYIVRFGDKVKIGLTKRPHKRLNALQSGQGINFEDVHLIVCDNIRKAEKILHRTYIHYRLRGEWFRLSHIQTEVLRGLIEYKEGRFIIQP